jgi:hypothetical protein
MTDQITLEQAQVERSPAAGTNYDPASGEDVTVLKVPREAGESFKDPRDAVAAVRAAREKAYGAAQETPRAPAQRPEPGRVDNDENPPIERYYDPQTAKKFEGATWQSAVKMAGKDLSDQHKVERYRELGHNDLTINDVSQIEAIADDPNDPRLFRLHTQPGNVNVSRIDKAGMSAEGQAVPHIVSDSQTDPIIQSKGGKIEMADNLTLREAQKYNQQDRERQVAEANWREREREEELRRLGEAPQEQAPQSAPAAVQPQQPDPLAQERQRLAAVAREQQRVF